MEKEWEAAQSTEINVDLVAAAKRQLKFLATVDRNRWLYEGPGVDKAIHRYNVCWLPLLEKYSESKLCKGPLVVPLDCEWIWHCHRLNPVRYKTDCEEFYGKILDNENVVSSLEGTSQEATKEIWKSLYPDEPYELDFESALKDNVGKRIVKGEKCTKYDLVSAVQRQSPFFYQVSRPYMNDTRYIEGAVARYKGFLHLIKRNIEKSIKSFSVPTYDIDLIWHTHQLHPVSYCNDLRRIMGKILEHDDSDSDRSKGQKLDVGFSGTTKRFEEMYGYRYWRAGAMYRGSAPSPVRTTPYTGSVAKKLPTSNVNPKITLPTTEVIEVMLEFVSVRNLPEGCKGSLFVYFSKTQPDLIFNAERSLTILSESGEKQVASFQCQPTGSLLLELVSFPSSLMLPKPSKTMGTASISLEDFLSPNSNLIVEKWLDLAPSSNGMGSKPIGLRVAVSVTVPFAAPYALNMVRSQPSSKNSCLFPLHIRVQFSKSWTQIIDEGGNLVLRLQMRDLKKSKGKQGCRRKEVVGITVSGEKHTLAEFAESEWSLANFPWSIKLPNTGSDDGHLLELTGPHTVRLFSGGRLDYEPRRCEKHNTEHKLEPHLITALEFSAEDPYGKAVALLDLKYGTIKVKEEWFLLPSFVLAFILRDIAKKEGYNSLVEAKQSTKQKGFSNDKVKDLPPVGSEANLAPGKKEMEANAEAGKENALTPAKGGACSGSCGSGCGTAVKTVNSGGCHGFGGMAVKSMESGGNGECGGSSSQPGNMAKCSGCGGSCSGTNMARYGGCGGGGGCGGSGSCGNRVANASSSGCGGGGGCGDGGSCGNRVSNANSGGDGCVSALPNQGIKPGNEIVVA